MIVDHTSIDEQIAVPQMAALEADLFGRERGANSRFARNSKRQHARICSILMMTARPRIAGLRVALPWMSRLLDRLQAILLNNSPLCAAMPVSGMTATMRKS